MLFMNELSHVYIINNESFYFWLTISSQDDSFIELVLELYCVWLPHPRFNTLAQNHSGAAVRGRPGGAERSQDSGLIDAVGPPPPRKRQAPVANNNKRHSYKTVTRVIPERGRRGVVGERGNPVIY